MMLFDTHAHYTDERFDEDRDAVLRSLPEHDVFRVICVGCGVSDSEHAIALSEKYDFVYTSIGIHPHQAGEVSDSDYDKIRALAAHPKVLAIGEIGLDYHYDFAPRDVQKECFARQIELAMALHLPITVHDREAHLDSYEILKAARAQRVAYHCYSGSLEYAQILIKSGYYISFAGAITFKNNRKASDIVKSVPEDRIMIETDLPYLTPEPFRGRRNDSTKLRYTAEKIAEFRGISYEAAAVMTATNAEKFFSPGDKV